LIDLSEDNDATAPLPSVFFKHKRERDEDLTGKENKRPAINGGPSKGRMNNSKREVGKELINLLSAMR
jgi:hypothetical protein